MNKSANAWLNGFIGMLIFSGSLPATRVAVLDFDPVFLTVARASIAGLLAALALVAFRQKRPARNELASLVTVALGVVVGFPLLTALALQHITAAYSMVFIGLLPLATGIFGVVRGGERPRPVFWLFAGMGSILVVVFAFGSNGSSSVTGALLMLAAILVCGLGYAEGAVLSRRLGGWQVICWALVLPLPLMLLAVLSNWPVSLAAVQVPAWIGLGYVSLFSMLIGFIFWYRGLALGGIAAVGQLQLLQPFFGLLLAATILGEPFTWSMVVVMVAAGACVVGAKRVAAVSG
ncbi:MAG TPA: DMT family transporter [Eoetvoesiella sp.]